RLERVKEILKGSEGQVKAEGSRDSGMEMNWEGGRHLGAAVGNTDFKRSYLMKKIAGWVSAVKKLAFIAATQPHAAFATFTQCLQGQWTFLSRTMLDAADLFQPLEESIRKDFIRALLKRDVNDLERDMLSLPARMGGLGLFKPTE